MRRAAFLALGLVSMAAAPPPVTTVHLIATDRHQSPLAGFRFSYNGVRSSATTVEGAATLEMPPGLKTGDPISLDLVLLGKKERDWFLPDPNINIPGPSLAAKLVLMRLAEFRSAARAVTQDLYPSQAELRLALVQAVQADGLSESQLDRALQALAESGDLADRTLAAYLTGQPSKLEELVPRLRKNRDEYATALRDLGASQYQAGSYEKAAASFRRAARIHGDDPALQRMLGSTLLALGDWAGAGTAFRRTLDLGGERIAFRPRFRPGDASALVYLPTSGSAEDLGLSQLFAALAGQSGSPLRPPGLSSFPDLLQAFQAANDPAAAEPARREALARDETRLGPDHPKVLLDLKALAESLESKGDTAEAESLVRRALRADEKIFGPHHPTVASDLTRLARLRERAQRPEEAERLLYRASTILLAFGRREGRAHPDLISTLVRYAQLRNRLGRPAAALHAMARRLPPAGAQDRERLAKIAELAAALPSGAWKWALLFGAASLTLGLIALGLQRRRRQAALASGRALLLVARDPFQNPVPGIRFHSHRRRTQPTNRNGETTLDLGRGASPGPSIPLALAGRAREQWFLLESSLRIPAPGSPAEVLVLRKSTFRQLHAEALAAGALAGGTGGKANEAGEGSLFEIAGRYGLKPGQIEEAIRAFSEAEDP